MSILLTEKIKLITQKRVKDPNTFQDILKDTVTSEVFAKRKSISRSEFYFAASTDLRPSCTFAMHPFEYNGEKYVEDEDGKRYKVIRTFVYNFQGMDYIELTVTEVIDE